MIEINNTKELRDWLNKYCIELSEVEIIENVIQRVIDSEKRKKEIVKDFEYFINDISDNIFEEDTRRDVISKVHEKANEFKSKLENDK